MLYLETLLSGCRFGVSHTAEGIDLLAKSGNHGGTANSSNRGGDLMLFVVEIVIGERDDDDAQEDNEQAFHVISTEEDSFDC